MSHLIIEQGKEVGQEVSVPAGGMKFGRSPANDLVLEDDAVMLFHGRFFFKSEGSLWVTDFGAGEKTTVDGQPIDEHQLKSGELVEVGSTAFRVINVSQDSDEAVAAPAPVKETRVADEEVESIDLGFKHSTVGDQAGDGAKRTKSAAMHRLMQVGIPVLVLVVLASIGSLMMNMDWDGAPQQTQQSNAMLLTFERVQADSSNIFRYYVTLDEKGKLSIQINELKNNLHFEKSVQLSREMLEQLAHSIEDAGFYKVQSDYAGNLRGQYDLFDLSVRRGHRYHRIRVLNNRLPIAIERTEKALKDFASRELKIPFTMTMPSQERIRYGMQALGLAKTRYAERDVRHSNLAESIKHYNEALLFLENIESRREAYEEAEAGLRMASEERDSRYDEYMFRADHSQALNEWSEAYKNLQICQELVPDREDPRYDKIIDQIMSVERHLR